MKITAGNSTYIDMWYHGMRDNCLCYTLTCHHCGFSVDPHEYEKGGGHRFCRGCGKYMFQNKHDYEAIPDLLDAVIDWTVPNNE